ncbi:MAG: helix-turn-helix domain-containing protein [Planctomyces sp.]|nr:helix-turn-helix domain-containing protein [Planctomyces sp.]
MSSSQSETFQQMPNTDGQENQAPATLARTAALNDFDQVRASFSNWEGQIDQLSTGRFSGTLRVVRGNSMRLLAIEGNQQILLRGRDATGTFSVYPVIPGNAGSTWRGHRLSSGHLVVVGTDVEVEHNSARTTQNLGVTLGAKELNAAGRILRADKLDEMLHTWAAFSPPPEIFDRLTRRLNALLKNGIADPTVLGTPEGHRLEQECLRSVVAAVFPESARGPELSLPGRSLLIRRAEEFMRARLGDPIGAIDLCRELGVSDRTLRLAFRERFGLGPMVYYKSLRLNAVRAMLRTSPEASIADVARAIGFHHLGNFASDYRRQFGERPSQTDRSDSQIVGMDSQ